MHVQRTSTTAWLEHFAGAANINHGVVGAFCRCSEPQQRRGWSILQVQRTSTTAWLGDEARARNVNNGVVGVFCTKEEVRGGNGAGCAVDACKFVCTRCKACCEAMRSRLPLPMHRCVRASSEIVIEVHGLYETQMHRCTGASARREKSTRRCTVGQSGRRMWWGDRGDRNATTMPTGPSCSV
jgi:hypothetical protein